MQWKFFRAAETVRCPTRKTPRRVLRYALTGIPTCDKIRWMGWRSKRRRHARRCTCPAVPREGRSWRGCNRKNSRIWDTLYQTELQRVALRASGQKGVLQQECGRDRHRARLPLDRRDKTIRVLRGAVTGCAGADCENVCGDKRLYDTGIFRPGWGRGNV